MDSMDMKLKLGRKTAKLISRIIVASIKLKPLTPQNVEKVAFLHRKTKQSIQLFSEILKF